MKTKAEATIEDLYRVPENGKAEIVNGEIVFMSPTGKLPNYAAGQIFVSLHQYALRTGVGHAGTDNLGFVVNLPHRKSISPDVSYYIDDLDMKFSQGGPLFAVEVRSEGDYGPTAEAEIINKLRDYFASGTQVVWDIDLLGTNVVKVYRADNVEHPNIYHRGEIANAEPALPGWALPVDELFPK